MCLCIYMYNICVCAYICTIYVCVHIYVKYVCLHIYVQYVCVYMYTLFLKMTQNVSLSDVITLVHIKQWLLRTVTPLVNVYPVGFLLNPNMTYFNTSSLKLSVLLSRRIPPEQPCEKITCPRKGA